MPKFPQVILFTLFSAFMFKGYAAPINIEDNRDITLTLSKTNYNRVVIKNDKIIEAVFPSHFMELRRDEEDGSAYIILQEQNPFTLFLTTENGHHFSVTVNSEESLGKTIELITKTPLPLKAQPAKAEKSVPTPKDPSLQIIESMEQNKPALDMKVSRPFGRAKHFGNISLIPQEIWENNKVYAEKINIYNASKKPLDLKVDWFSEKDVVAMKLSTSTLKPHETAVLYRVHEVQYG